MPACSVGWAGGWAIGFVMHIVTGTVILPLIYALVVYPFLHGPPVAKGMTCGVIMWLVVQLIVMPITDAGIFSANTGGSWRR